MKNSIHCLFLNVIFFLLNPYAHSDPVDHCINIVCEKPIRDEISCRDTPPSAETNETVGFFFSHVVELGHLDCSYVHENGDVFSEDSKYIDRPEDYRADIDYNGKLFTWHILFLKIQEQCLGDENCRRDRGCHLRFERGDRCWAFE